MWPIVHKNTRLTVRTLCEVGHDKKIIQLIQSDLTTWAKMLSLRGTVLLNAAYVYKQQNITSYRGMYTARNTHVWARHYTATIDLLISPKPVNERKRQDTGAKVPIEPHVASLKSFLYHYHLFRVTCTTEKQLQLQTFCVSCWKNAITN